MPIDSKRNAAVALSDYKAINVTTPVVQTAPGTSASLDISAYRSFTVQYKIENINTSVSVRIEGSVDNTDFFTLLEGGDTIKTANGTHAFISPPFVVVPYIRYVFVDETGGTDAQITWTLAAG